MRLTPLGKVLSALDSAALDSAAVRLGRIGFINTVPVYHGLQQALPPSLASNMHVISHTPMGLNQAIIAGELELSPVSTAWYAQHQRQLTLLPGLSVSSFGSVESVLLVSDFPLDEWTGQPIAVPDDSATSIAVLRALIQHHSGADPVDAFVVYPAHLQEKALQEYSAVLTIGDRALAWQHRPKSATSTHPHTIDLATAWNEFTQEPLVFAVWVARTDWLCEHESEASLIMEALVASTQQFLTSSSAQHQAYESLASSTAFSEAIVSRYWTQSLDYGWGASHQAGVQRLVQLMAPSQSSCLV